MKKLSSEALKSFRDRLEFDVTDEQLEGDLPPYIHPGEDSEVVRVPQGATRGARRVRARAAGVLPVARAAGHDVYAALKEGSGNQPVATTMALVRVFKDLLRIGDVGKRIVPIIPDEARTFGMDSWFPTAKIYDHLGQTYEPVDRELLLSYKQATDGQIIHEGITEPGRWAPSTPPGRPTRPTASR
jgi:pyruvate dehydrogenase E1 component